MIDRAVARDREQPGAEGAAAGLEGLDAVPHAQKGFLDQIFGGGRVANDGENDGIREFPETIVKIFHGVWLAALQAAREFFVVLPAEFKREDESWKNHEASMSISRIRDRLHTFTYESERRSDGPVIARRRGRAFFA